MQCAVYIVHCAGCSLQCVMCSVQSVGCTVEFVCDILATLQWLIVMTCLLEDPDKLLSYVVKGGRRSANVATIQLSLSLFSYRACVPSCANYAATIVINHLVWILLFSEICCSQLWWICLSGYISIAKQMNLKATLNPPVQPGGAQHGGLGVGGGMQDKVDLIFFITFFC